jgi:DNA-binding LacI/PurR family transcriptional regulator
VIVILAFFGLKFLLMKRTMTISVIIPDISNPYNAQIVRSISRNTEAGYWKRFSIA